MLETVAAIICVLLLSAVDGDSRPGSLHKPTSNLSCFMCNTVDHNGDTCKLDLGQNLTPSFEHKCASDEIYCTIVRVKYVLDGSRESVLWSVERNCSNECQDGCITMGERTKLHMCRFCCKDNFCNFGTDAAGSGPNSLYFLITLCMTFLFLDHVRL